MQWLLKKPIAHRGVHTKELCENSLGAFTNAISKNYAIELDVQLTQDEQLVVFHDENSFRLTNNSFEVSATPYKELRKLTLLETQEHIPLLSEVLSLVQGKVPLLIELKNREFNEKMQQQLAIMLDNYKGEVAISSFNHKSIKWFGEHRPSILRGLNFGNIKKYNFLDFLTFLYRFDRSEPNFVAVEYPLLKTLIVKYCRFLKIPLICWNVDTEEKKEKALKKVQNIMIE
ncbi:MAG: glycerophosphodiester phosphodiesterase family protein [Arcobacteraceae bacterium]